MKTEGSCWFVNSGINFYRGCNYAVKGRNKVNPPNYILQVIKNHNFELYYKNEKISEIKFE
jgi:hypothetical protein